jgi:hypothetical protein
MFSSGDRPKYTNVDPVGFRVCNVIAKAGLEKYIQCEYLAMVLLRTIVV